MNIEEKIKLTEQVKELIGQVRPYLQADGGDVVFVELTDDMVVKVELQGACGSCPYRLMTLKNGVEEVVKKALPQIKSVESI